MWMVSDVTKGGYAWRNDGTFREYELWEQDRESISKSYFAELNWLVN